MRAKLFVALLASTLGSLAFADAPGITYAIDNPLRPGAKAAHCPAQAQVIDGCTFHSVAGDTYSARLALSPGETWVASTPDTGTVKLQPQAQEGQDYQVIRVIPNPATNADTTVTFDRLIGAPGSQKVVERRRISVMIHPA
ncbi:MAG: hypothetical protein P0Y58_19965 [Candidatus Pseudomonas phytovorans]|uniref:DUF4124 domain-containing protein n=1 Tax=Candidatus Pseudomonas phytovorans TaxID=3121377 RepID=A0AAJ5WE83_9PSED|nr:hypothetical protein [Pseudomonas sp.]WEK29170.1 MAG: hypothetical protein P0Y58_19965 [Pseudomonas sp.]